MQLIIGPSKNFLSHIGNPCVSSYIAHTIQEPVPTLLRVLTWSETSIQLKGTLVGRSGPNVHLDK